MRVWRGACTPGMWARNRVAILLFGAVNAVLFSALLPLWEGFDEAYHYAYVESLWQTGLVPVLGVTRIPQDVAESLRVAPLSHVVVHVTPEATSFDQWFALPVPERERRRRDLERLRPEVASGVRANYEAHQPPLAYLLLAPVDWALSGFSITVRVLVLRLLGAVAAVLLLFFGANGLCRVLQVPERFATTALYLIFCSEMLYATTAHVANDWLAIGISACFLAALAEFAQVAGPPKANPLANARGSDACTDPLANARGSDRAGTNRSPERKRVGLLVGRLCLWLAAGLLTKAYFLVFAVLTVLVAAVLVWRRRLPLRSLLPGALILLVLAGPWYARNLALYGNLSGTQEAYDGIGLRQSMAAATHIDWWSTSGFLARGSLWTGNNSFGTFSRMTLDVILGLLALGMLAWCGRRGAIAFAEWVMGAAIVLFSVGVAYASCASFADKGAEVAGASPWYTQVLLVPVIALACLGWSRWQRVGRAIAAVSVVLWTWVLVATWMFKLFPLYSGANAAPMRAREIVAWYAHDAAEHSRDLSLTALAPAGWLYAGMAVSVLLALLLAALTIRERAIGWRILP